MLRARYAKVAFAGWRRQVREALEARGIAASVRYLLGPLTPDAAYFPDFLTPPEGLLGLPAGLDALLATPRHRLFRELRLTFGDDPPPYARRLAEGDPVLRRDFVRCLRAYFKAALEPYWDRMSAGAEIAYVRLMRRRRDGGPGALLAGLERARWRPPFLEMSYPAHRELRLAGRGIVLIPSWFCWHHPVALADPGLPPVLVYPMRPATDFVVASEPGGTEAALGRLIGTTRLRVLLAAAEGGITTELAVRAGVSLATASEHAAVLRAAGLISSRRDANSIVHVLTPLGRVTLHHAAGA